jgi:excisionase family DNA binding protein
VALKGVTRVTDEKWLTVAEVAERLRLNPETIRRWLRRGDLKGIVFSDRGGYRVSESQLADFIERRKLAA